MTFNLVTLRFTSERGGYSIHRVVVCRGRDPFVVTRGDSMPEADLPVLAHELLGKVDFIVRNGKSIAPARRMGPHSARWRH